MSYCSSSFGRLKGLAAWRTVVSWCSHLLWRHGPLKIRAYETWHPGGASGPCSWVHWSYRQWSLLCMDFISLPVWVLSKVGTVLLIGRQEYEDAVWRHECKGYASSIQKVAWQMKTCPPLAGEGGDRIPRIEPQRKKLMNEDKDKSKFHTPQLFETISWFAKFAWFWRLCSGVRGTSRGSMKWSALFVSYWKSWRRPTYVRAAFWEVKPSNLVKHLGHIWEFGEQKRHKLTCFDCISFKIST